MMWRAAFLKFIFFFSICFSFLSAVAQDSLVFSTNFKRYVPASNPSGIRIFLIHGGFEGSSLDWEAEPYFTFRKTLVDSGAEVVTFDRPFLKKEHLMTDSGRAYRKGFADQIRKIVSDVETLHGKAKETVVAGISLGGLHAMMAVVVCPDLFSKYIAVLPVTDLKVMPEMKGVNPVFFNPFNEIELLSSKPCLFIYGTKDKRVKYRLTVKLAKKVMMNGQLVAYKGTGHETKPEMAADISDWLNNTHY